MRLCAARFEEFWRSFVTALVVTVFVVLFVLVGGGVLRAQDAAGGEDGESLRIAEMRFQNQPIADILFSLAQAAGVSIVPDDTVRGDASYYFAETDFRTALQAFLETYHLYVEQRNGIYHVSRIFTAREAGTADEGDRVTVRAREVSVSDLVPAVSRAIGRTVLFDRDGLGSAAQRISIHAENLPPQRVLEIIARQLPEHELETESDYYYIRRVAREAPDGSGRSTPAGRPFVIERDGDVWSSVIQRGRSREILQELFGLAGVEHAFLTQRDELVTDLAFEGRSFAELLELILYQINLDYVVQDDTYFLVEVQRRDILKQFREHRVLFVEHFAVQELPSLFPQDLASSNLFKLDRERNVIILSGTRFEIDPIESFIRDIDVPRTNRRHVRIDVEYSQVSDVLGVLPGRFQTYQPQRVPGTNSFIVLIDDSGLLELEEFLSYVDTAGRSEAVRLRYIRASDLLDNLPPAVGSDDIVRTSDPTLVFFRGSGAKREAFFEQLAVIDRPVPQIRYNLLVVQYQRGSGLNFEIDHEIATVDTDDDETWAPQLVAALGSLLRLNFDVVAHFGMQFATILSGELTSSNAQVFADTTLNGISGENVRFQNTDTFRYRDVEIDPDTGQPRPTGVTREITAGLILQVEGWTSGDNMITMDVSATVSKRGANTRGDHPPPTSERVVQTHVRTPAGEPVVIGGLIQRDASQQESGVPILGSIPLLGRLFRRTRESVEETEMVIYIVPFVESGLREDADDERWMLELYETFVEPEGVPGAMQ